MKDIKANIVRGLPIGARVNVVDNSGAKLIRIISVKGHKTRRSRISSAAIADLVKGTVLKGKQDMTHKLVDAVIVRQKKEYTRADGTKVKFYDNSAIVLKDVRLGLPKGTLIKGPIAKEVAIRWSAVAKTASVIL